MLRQVDAGLDALSGALAAGFDDYKTVRTDKSLATLRKSPKFTVLINRYDEPLINEGAIKCGPPLSIACMCTQVSPLSESGVRTRSCAGSQVQWKLAEV